MPVKIAIVGKPNVGKSTLFNYFVNKKLALALNVKGLTRDRQTAKASLFDFEFEITDTAGFENEHKLSAQIKEQIMYAVAEADILFFVVDGREGITSYDLELSRLLLKNAKNVICLVNKCEGNTALYLDKGGIYKLGFKDICYVSAEHNLGFADLYEKVIELKNKLNITVEEEPSEKPIKIAVIGKPNAGKSTFINSLLGQDRVLASDLAGTTRDAIKIRTKIEDKFIEIVDTAGIRKKSQIRDEVEQLAVSEAFRAVRLAEIVIYLIDATSSKFIKQDLALIKHAFNEGRVVIVALNKWDVMKDSGEFSLTELQKSINLELDVVSDYPVCKMSALRRKDTVSVLKQALKLYEKWNRRVKSAELNREFAHIVSKHQPKLHKGKAVRLKYITQGKTRPPTFYINCNMTDGVTDDYLRYVRKQLQSVFDLDHIAIRINLTKSKNPYVNK